MYLALSLLLSSCITIGIWNHNYSTLYVVAWFGSMLLAIIATGGGVLLLIFLPLVVRVAGYYATYLKIFNRNEPYVYIIAMPFEFKYQFIAKDAHATYIDFSDSYGILVNNK